VKVTLNQRQKVMIVVGLGLILLLLVAKQTVLNATPPGPIAVNVPPPHKVAVRVHHVVRHVARRPAAPKVDPTLPAPLRTALRQHGVVVAVLYAPVPGDGAVVAAAAAGARAAHVGFAALDVRGESVAEAMASKLPSASDPSIVVVRRPGTFAAVFPGVTDASVVAQAAKDAG